MSEFPDLLKKLRREKGMNQNELAQALGVSKTAVSNYETGYAPPSSNNLRKIASFFDVSLSELLGENPNVLRESPISFSQNSDIPIYPSISVLSVPLPLYSLNLPPAMLGEGSFFGLRVTGDRMDRLSLTEGSIAIVRRQSFADDSDVVVVSVESDPAVICRFFRSGDYISLAAESSNPGFHPIIVNPLSQSLTIFGKVIRVIHSIM